jgi:hypothetical protein
MEQLGIDPVRALGPRPHISSMLTGYVRTADNALAAVLYIGLGVMARTVVLNWIVGPLFPFLVVYFVPRRIRLWRARRSSRRAAS